MEADGRRTLGRRELLVRAAPACAMGCLGLGGIQELLAAQLAPPAQEVHKFDRERDAKLSVRAAYRMQYSQFFELVRNLRATLGDEDWTARSATPPCATWTTPGPRPSTPGSGWSGRRP